MTYTSRCIKER